MKITLRNSMRPNFYVIRELDVDEAHGLAFVRGSDAAVICCALFGSFFCEGLGSIEAKDEDGNQYLVLLR